MGDWAEADIPDQLGRVAVVTGGNSGIGFETARALAGHGATVVLASRNVDRTKAAVDRIAVTAPGAQLSAVRLDLGSLDSVRTAAEEISAAHPRIDLLVNNAGVTKLSEPTPDGFEPLFGINHLGTFALTGRLLDRLLATRGSRVVTVSSIAHRGGQLDLADLASTGDQGRDYSRSKLANLLFSYELARRLTAAGALTLAVAAHPGIASTDMSRKEVPALADLFMSRVLGRTPARGALPSLRAATDPAARSGDYYGPSGLLGIFGEPAPVPSSDRSHDTDLQRALWTESERLTGVTYPLTPP